MNYVTKKVLYSGRDEPPKYSDGSKITFHFQTYAINAEGETGDIIDDSKKVKKPMEMILGKQFKMPIWEECLKTMKVEEVAEFSIKKCLLDSYPLVSKSFREFAGIGKGRTGHCCGMMAFTEGVGHPDLDILIREPKDLLFRLEILKVENPGEYKKEAWSMNPEEKLKTVPDLKDEGNMLYKSCQYEEAAKRYADALGMLEQLLLREKPGDEEWKNLEKIQIPILSNYAQCKLLLKDYYSVIENTTKILEKDKDNVKALYRRGKAYIGTWDLEPARSDFERVAELDPSFKTTILKELQNIKTLQQQKDEELKNKLKGKGFVGNSLS